MRLKPILLASPISPTLAGSNRKPAAVAAEDLVEGLDQARGLGQAVEPPLPRRRPTRRRKRLRAAAAVVEAVIKARPAEGAWAQVEAAMSVVSRGW